MLSADIEWARLLFGLFCIAAGMGFLFSRRFTPFALRYDGRGNMWVNLLGPKYAALVSRWIFSAFSIGAGAYLAYLAIVPGHGN
jgi:hypothetical protein